MAMQATPRKCELNKLGALVRLQLGLGSKPCDAKEADWQQPADLVLLCFQLLCQRS